MSRISVVVIAVISALVLTACSGGGGGGGIGGASFSLTYNAPGGTGFVGGTTQNLPFSPAVQTDLMLSTGVAIAGQITDGGGAPLIDAEVRFKKYVGAPSVDSDGTDAGGNYTGTLPEGQWVAMVDSGVEALGTMTFSNLLVAAPGPVTLDLQFPARVTISGTVFDSLGVGIPGAQIDIKGDVRGADVTVTTDPAGFYTAAVIPDTYEITVDPSNGTDLKQRWYAVPTTATVTRNFNMTAGTQITGTVLTNLGLPLMDDTDVEVVLPPNSPWFRPDTATTSEVDGTYSMSNVPPGNIVFELDPPGDSGFPRIHRTVGITGTSPQVVDFSLILGVVLSGTILRDDGVTPELDVEVAPIPTNGSLAPDDDETDALGFFEISVFPGNYTINITPEFDNFQLPEVRTLLITTATTLDVTLARGVLVTGTVMQPDGLTPAPEVDVAIPGFTGADDTTDGTGNYVLLAPPGTHTITLTPQDGFYKDMAIAPFTGVAVALPGPVVFNMTMALAITGSTVVTGTVYAPDGITPVAGAEIEAYSNALLDVVGRALSGANGTYVLVIQ